MRFNARWKLLNFWIIDFVYCLPPSNFSCCLFMSTSKLLVDCPRLCATKRVVADDSQMTMCKYDGVGSTLNHSENAEHAAC